MATDEDQAEDWRDPTVIRRSEPPGAGRRTTGPLVKQAVAEPPLEPTSVRGGAPADALLGATLGEYRVVAKLGEGGGGVVYRGEQPLIGRAVAIKVLHSELNREDPAHARRFLEEARAVSAARHPNIIDVFGFGHTPAGDPYLVMELLEGEPLDRLLKRRGQLRLKEALELVMPVLGALSAAHAAGITHRDLKPANIFIVSLRDGTTYPKLLDFGLARRGAAGEWVRQTSVGGTPLYIAPEQASGDAVGPQTDLYSLGCVIYELLAGAPPFTAVNLHELIDQHLTLAPPPLRERAPHVPEALERLVLRMLEKDPARRPASALEVKEALQQQYERAAVSVAPTRVGARVLSGRRSARHEATDVNPALEAPRQTDVNQALAPASSSRGPLLAAMVLGVLLLGGLVAWALLREAPVEPRPPPRVAKPEPVTEPVVDEPAVPTEPEPAVVPPEPEPAKPEPVTPVVEPAKPEPDGPRKPAVRRHTVKQVKLRWRSLSERVRGLPEDLRRAARLQLDEARFCSASPDECWAELSEIEATFFPK
ncbi:MAG: serine/threonine-protein kinase [Myxococcota bacterium]